VSTYNGDAVGAAIAGSEIDSGNIEAIGNGFSIVHQNLVNGGNISVIDDVSEWQQEVIVRENNVTGGNITVQENKKADVKHNKTTAGNIGCEVRS
jgi:hypothetical protein